MGVRAVALGAVFTLAGLCCAAMPAAAVTVGPGGFSSERLWGPHNDWEPNIAAAPGSPWLYQMTTQYGGHRVCAPDMNHCILFRSSPDRGRTWTGLHDFRRAAGLSFTDKPWIAISPSGRDVYVAFKSSDSYVSASHDYGRTWATPVKTNTNGRYWFAEAGAVAPDGGVYFAESAEHQDAKGDILLAVLSSANGGASWRTSYVARSQQQPAVRASPLQDGVAGLTQQPEQVARRIPGLGQEWRERAERNGRRGAGGNRLGGDETQPGGRLGGLGGEPGLAHARRPGQHKRGRFRAFQLGEDPVHLRVPRHERDLAGQCLSHCRLSSHSGRTPAIASRR